MKPEELIQALKDAGLTNDEEIIKLLDDAKALVKPSEEAEKEADADEIYGKI